MGETGKGSSGLISKSTTITSGGLTASALSVVEATVEAFSAPSVTNVPISNVPTPGILWGAAATAATNAFMMTEAFLAKAEEVAKIARRVARRSGGDDGGGGPMTYAQIGKAYQASLKAFKENLMKDGLTEDQANAFKSQAAKNGSIASVAGAVYEAAKEKKEAEWLAETNQRMEDKMADIDAADEARWTESQAVIAEREKAAEAAKQKALDDFRAGEQEDANNSGVQEPKRIQPFLSWLPPLSLEHDVDIPLIKNMFVSSNFIDIGYNLNVEARTLSNLPVHLGNKGPLLNVGPVELSTGWDDNSFGLGISFPAPFQKPSSSVVTSMASVELNLAGWDSSFRYSADQVVTTTQNNSQGTSESVSEGLYVEWKPAKVAGALLAVSALVAGAILLGEWALVGGAVLKPVLGQ